MLFKWESVVVRYAFKWCFTIRHFHMASHIQRTTTMFHFFLQSIVSTKEIKRS